MSSVQFFNSHKVQIERNPGKSRMIFSPAKAGANIISMILFDCLQYSCMLLIFLPLKSETNMNWNWISRDIGKSSGHPAWKRFLLVYTWPFLVYYSVYLYFKRNHLLMTFSSFMQEKEAALNLTVDVFCRLVKQHTNVAQLLTMYAHSSFLHHFLC